MGLYIRKSFKLGPLRLNLSKSGLGASLGTKGARLGLSAKGKLYTHLGRWGLYQRQDLGSIELPPATSSKGIGFWILIALGILVVLVIPDPQEEAPERRELRHQLACECSGRRQPEVPTTGMNAPSSNPVSPTNSPASGRPPRNLR